MLFQGASLHSDSVSHLASTFTPERYDPHILAQHVNDGKKDNLC